MPSRKQHVYYANNILKHNILYHKVWNLVPYFILSILKMFNSLLVIFTTLLGYAIAENLYAHKSPIKYYSGECDTKKESYEFRNIRVSKKLLYDVYDAPTSGVQKYNAYLEQFFASNSTLTLDEWKAALPTDEERQEMKDLIAYLYDLHDFSNLRTNSLLSKYANLQKYLNLTILQDKYVIVHEKIPIDGKSKFPRFWGYVAICAKGLCKNPYLHHSAAHFESDGEVCNEAASIFEGTGSRSLVIAGANRYAVMGDNPSTCQSLYQVADASHNDEPIFFTMNVAIHDAARQDASKNSRSFSDTFFEWHGMAETSCQSAPIFISAGVHGNHSIYDEGNCTVNKLEKSVEKNFGPDSVRTPRTDSTCRLIASSNVFGRYVNGVPENHVCKQDAKDQDIHGQFVHIEQKHKARCSWDLWAKSINEAFDQTTSGSRSTKIGYVVYFFVFLYFLGALRIFG